MRTITHYDMNGKKSGIINKIFIFLKWIELSKCARPRVWNVELACALVCVNMLPFDVWLEETSLSSFNVSEVMGCVCGVCCGNMGQCSLCCQEQIAGWKVIGQKVKDSWWHKQQPVNHLSNKKRGRGRQKENLRNLENFIWTLLNYQRNEEKGDK